MSELKKTNVRIVRKVDVSASLISAVSSGRLDNVKKLAHSYGSFHCECGNGGYVPLFVAVKLGHIEITKFLLQEGASTDCETDNVSTPLHLATEQGYSEIVQLLLEKNAPVNSQTEKNETPLHFAAKEGHSEIVKVLLSNHASVTAQTNEGLTPLFFAVEGRHEEVVRMLLQHACSELNASAKPTDSNFLDHVLLCNPSVRDKVNELVACIVTHDNGKSGIVNELIDHGFILSREYVNETPLLAAVKKNYAKFIHSVLRSGSNPSDAKHNPLLLHTAVRNGREEIIKLFLNSGFDANAKNEKGKTCLCYSLNCGEKDKYVGIIQLLLGGGANVKEAPELLHRAVSEGLIEVCKLLIKSGADVSALNTQDETPLYLSVSKFRSNYSSAYGHEIEVDDTTRLNITSLLLYGGADLKIDKDGSTAFHHAVRTEREELVSVFLNFGVDADLPAELGITPLFIAFEKRHARMVEILCKHGADLSGHPRALPLLQLAVVSPKAEVVNIFLKFGADIGFRVSEDSVFSDYDEHRHVIGIIKKHIIKSNAAGLHISRPNAHLDYEPFSDFKRECEEEVENLKNEKINHQFTLYDILVEGKKPSFAKNKSLMEILQSVDFDRFPIYKSLITTNLEISEFRLELLQSGQRYLDIIVKISSKLNGDKVSVLPADILEEIVSYLSYSDIKNLICCGKVLKFQLSQN